MRMQFHKQSVHFHWLLFFFPLFIFIYRDVYQCFHECFSYQLYLLKKKKEKENVLLQALLFHKNVCLLNISKSFVKMFSSATGVFLSFTFILMHWNVLGSHYSITTDLRMVKLHPFSGREGSIASQQTQLNKWRLWLLVLKRFQLEIIVMVFVLRTMEPISIRSLDANHTFGSHLFDFNWVVC